jgi:hypothetical protein
MKFLKDLEEDIEVVEVLEVEKLVEEGQLVVIIVMRRDILLNIFLFQDILGVPTIETTPIPLSIVPS